MNILDYLAKRADKKQTVDKSVYFEGVLDITSYLFLELWKFMKEENRYFGIIPTYEREVAEDIEKFNESVKLEDIEIYGKILYLFKPLLIKDFKKLCAKHLSKADAVIVLLHKLIDILRKEDKENRAERIQKIVEKLYNNIRNNAKKMLLPILTSSIDYYMRMGWVGKCATYEIYIEEERTVKKEPLEGSGLRFDESENCISEIVWKDE